MNWTQIYDPFGHWWLSTLVAALPIFVLFGLLAGLKVKPHWCAIAGAATAVAVAIVFFKMPDGRSIGYLSGSARMISHSRCSGSPTLAVPAPVLSNGQ